MKKQRGQWNTELLRHNDSIVSFRLVDREISYELNVIFVLI